MRGKDSKRARQGSPDMEPSKVVFVRGILPNTSEMEVQRVFEQYGQVRCVFLIPKQHQALVEFSALAEAENLLQRQANGGTVLVREQPVGLSFSKQSRITDPRKLYLSPDPTRILLFTLFHIEVQIDCDTFRQICSRYGRLNRICLTRNGIDTQAIVEFDRVDEAAEAKPNLNGADIYENCNTLRVEFVTEMVYDVLTRDPRSVLDEWPARNRSDGERHQPLPLPPSRGVARRGDRSRDRSRSRSRDRDRQHLPPIGAPSARRGRRPSPPPPPPPSRPPAPSSSTGTGRDVVSNLINLASQLSDLRVPGLDTRNIMQYLQAAAANASDSGAAGGGGRHERSRSGSRGRGSDRDYHRGGAASSASSLRHQPTAADAAAGSIVFLCGLSQQLNCDRLFNLLCIYGNVRVVKFFASNSNMAMVEMTDRAAAAMCVRYLHNRTILGRRSVVDFARQNSVKNTDNLASLPDGSPCVKDYMDVERSLNRFLTPEKARKNQPLEPRPSVYFWGVPPDADQHDVMSVLRDLGAPAPDDVLFFNNQGVRSGIMTFANTSDAIDAICLANHADFRAPSSGRTCMLKLTFSEAARRTSSGRRIADAAGGDKNGGGGGGRSRSRGGGKRRASGDF